MDTYQALQDHVITGQQQKVAELTRQCLDQGAPAKEILQQGLLPGMAVVGKKFQEGEFFIPEMLLAARALNAGLDIVKPMLEESDIEPVLIAAALSMNEAEIQQSAEQRPVSNWKLYGRKIAVSGGHSV